MTSRYTYPKKYIDKNEVEKIVLVFANGETIVISKSEVKDFCFKRDFACIGYFTMKKLVCVFLIASLLLFSAFASSCEGQKDISTYIISAKYDEEEKTLTATMDFTFFNDTEREITDLKFNLYGNAFRQGAVCSPVYSAYRDLAYYNGESYGSMSVLNVENCSAWDVAGEDENILRVNLNVTPVFSEIPAASILSVLSARQDIILIA